MASNPRIHRPTGTPENVFCDLKAEKTVTWSAQELIRKAKEHPPEPIITGLLNEGDILLIHGSEESFKSVFVLQMAESIAIASPLLRYWKVPRVWRVGVIETEIHEVMLGERLSKMFPKGDAPKNLCFMGKSALRDWRRLGLRQKLEFVQKWIVEEGIEFLLIDTANDFFRGADNPSMETHVGTFFDELRNLKVAARGIVRHDSKKKGEDSNGRIRGSAEWKEDPEAIISLERVDRRTNQVEFEIGKLRYGQKPEPLSLWFDAKAFRLTPLPPMIEVLFENDSSRTQLLSECLERFGLCARKVDAMIADLKAKTYVIELQDGHKKVFQIDLDHIEGAPWKPFILGE